MSLGLPVIQLISATMSLTRWMEPTMSPMVRPASPTSVEPCSTCSTLCVIHAHDAKVAHD